MKITEILKRRGNIREVRFDDGTYILLDKRLFEEAALKEGDEISEEKADFLEDTSDELRCKNRAMYYLSGADYSVSALKKKLFTAGFCEPYVSKTVARLSELKLLDDTRYCKRFVEYSREQNLSEREIKEKAKLKGIPYDIIKEVLEENEQDEVQRIVNLLCKKYLNKLEDEADAEKVIASLARKGFKFSDIRSALRLIEFGETE